MRSHRLRSSVALAALALLGSCDNPLCACSPEPLAAVLVASVRTAADEPVEGLRLRAEPSMDASCETYRITVGGSRITGSSGTAVFTIEGLLADSLCVRLYASDSAAGSPETLLPETPKVQPRLFPFDTVAVTLQFPP